MFIGHRTLILMVAFSAWAIAAGNGKKQPEPTPLDRYIEEALSRQNTDARGNSTGSLWIPSSRLIDLGSDLRAAQVNDMITILVTENASAVANGATKTQRQSSLNASITALGGPKNPAGALANLANTSSASKLDGEGSTSRSTSITTTLSARVTQVLPNGYLVIEGAKEVGVNSERQLVTLRGVVRPADLTSNNIIRSDQIAQMELRVNGKGVVNDAVRRPFILYRILMGLLPF